MGEGNSFSWVSHHHVDHPEANLNTPKGSSCLQPVYNTEPRQMQSAAELQLGHSEDLKHLQTLLQEHH